MQEGLVMAGGRDEREKRLAEALRANLRRRRQQLRQRSRQPDDNKNKEKNSLPISSSRKN